VTLSSISIESGNEYFVIEQEFLIDIIHHKLIRNFSSSSDVEIPSNIEILGSECFSFCKSLSSISFESNSRLIRIESQAFHELDVVVVIPSTIEFIGSDAIPNVSQIQIPDGDYCHGFDRWRQLNEFGVKVDFRRIFRVGYELGSLRDYEIQMIRFEEGSVIGCFDDKFTRNYFRCDDYLRLVVKWIAGLELIEDCAIEKEINQLLNLRHPCISAPIGIVFPDEFSELRELKIVQIYSEGISLAEVISMNPVWWTGTAKAKAIAGIVLGIRFAHSLGLIHGHLNSNHIIFDSDYRIQITDFCVIEEEVETKEKVAKVGVRSIISTEWSAKIDFDGFILVLIEILVGHPVTHSDVSHGRILLSPDVPTFVSQLISADESSDQGISESFNDIFNILKMNDFQILSDVDSVEVLRFVDWVECFE
jgi:hypothetical protein